MRRPTKPEKDTVVSCCGSERLVSLGVCLNHGWPKCPTCGVKMAKRPSDLATVKRALTN